MKEADPMDAKESADPSAKTPAPPKPKPKKRSGISDILKLGPTNKYEVTDEMADARFDSKSETDALIKELIRLHSFTHQIRGEMEIFNHITIKVNGKMIWTRLGPW